MADTTSIKRDSGLPAAKHLDGGSLEDVLTGSTVSKVAALSVEDDSGEQGVEDDCILHGIKIVR